MGPWYCYQKSKPNPPTPFELRDANSTLFNEVLTSWSESSCCNCKMLIAARGVYRISDPRLAIHQGGRTLELEGTVDGVVIQHDDKIDVYGAALILRRITMDGEYTPQIMAGFIYTGARASIEFYNSTFVRHNGINGAGVVCLRGNSSFVASSCIFKDNLCSDVYGGGAVTLNGFYDFNEVHIEYSVFRNNTSKGGGGAVRAFGMGRMTLFASQFVGQRAFGWGGAVYVDDLQALASGPDTGPPFPRLPGNGNLTCVIDECRFVDNLLLGLKDPKQTYYGGGAVYTLANTTITNSVFLSNRAIAERGREKDTLAGGGAIWNEGRLKARNLQLIDNMAGKMGGGMVLARGAAVLTQILFESNTAGTQGGGLFVNGTLTPSSTNGSKAASSSLRPRATGFLKNSAFYGNQVLGGSLYNDTSYDDSFDPSFSTFESPLDELPASPRYKVGGAALSVWGQLLVLDSSFEGNTIKDENAAFGGAIVRLESQGVLQLAFCSFNGGPRQGLAAEDLYVATVNGSLVCMGTSAAQQQQQQQPVEGASGLHSRLLGAGQGQCTLGAQGLVPWTGVSLYIILFVPLGLFLYVLVCLWPKLKKECRWANLKKTLPGAPPPSPAAGLSPSLMRNMQSPFWERLSSHHQYGPEARREFQRQYDKFILERSRRLSHPVELDGMGGDVLPLAGGGGGVGGDGGGSGFTTGSSAATTALKPKRRRDDDVLLWTKTRAYALSKGLTMRDDSDTALKPNTYLISFQLEGRGQNMFRVTKAMPIACRRFGYLYHAENTGGDEEPQEGTRDGSAAGGSGGDRRTKGVPCLCLVYNRFKYESSTLETEKDLLHTGSSSTCPYLIRHMDDFFHEKIGYYIALAPACQETLQHRLQRAAADPVGQGYDFATLVRYLHEILQGLGALRDLRMVHGRLSLTSVLLTSDDHVRLWDYGVSASAPIRSRFPEYPTVFTAPEFWDLHKMNPAPVTAMDSWGVGVVAYMLAAHSLQVVVPACAEGYLSETYREYLYEYEQQRLLQQHGALYPEEEGLLLPVDASEPYFPTLPSIHPDVRAEDRRDHGSALVNIISLLLDVSPGRRLGIMAAEYSVRQMLRRILAKSEEGDGRAK